MKTTDTSVSQNLPRKARNRRFGYTLLEVLAVVMILGILAAVAVPAITQLRDSTLDATKTKNAGKLNEAAKTLFEAGYDASGFADGEAFITALKAGIVIETPLSPGSSIKPTVKIDQSVTAAAYTYTKATASAPAYFVAKLGDRTVMP